MATRPRRETGEREPVTCGYRLCPAPSFAGEFGLVTGDVTTLDNGRWYRRFGGPKRNLWSVFKADVPVRQRATKG